MDVYVAVTSHTLDRARQRFPELAQPREVIVSEVLAAIASHRMATKLPRWALQPGKRRRRGDPWIRFVWNEQRTRVYPIDRRQKEIVVITVIRPGEPAADTTAA